MFGINASNFKDIVTSSKDDYQLMLDNLSKDDLVKRYEEILFENLSLQRQNEELIEKNFVLRTENEQLKQSLMVQR